MIIIRFIKDFKKRQCNLVKKASPIRLTKELKQNIKKRLCIKFFIMVLLN
jgi:hypothetical protein